MSKKYWGGQEDNRNSPWNRGNSRKERNRVQLMEDLYGPEAARLELEAHQRPCEHIGESLGKFMQKIKLDSRFELEVLIEKWETVVGKQLITLCRPAALSDGILQVAVNYAAGIQVLEQYHKKEILSRSQAICSSIKQVKFVPAERKI